MKVLSVQDLARLLECHGFEQFLKDLLEALRRDYSRWEEFDKMPRPGMHVPGGVLELMPVCDKTYYTFKYVNCHPKNPDHGEQTVVATGQLSRIDTGYPRMFSEMTLLTALRTAANAALATELMSRKDSKVMALIGTGCQSEFQVRANQLVRNLEEIRYFDTDPEAMKKFAKNMANNNLKLTACKNAEEAVKGADIITVCTACKAHVDVIKNDWIKPGMHINALGGDCKGKTELELSILSRAKVVVEYFDQSIAEGEIQRYSRDDAKKLVAAEFTEVMTAQKPGRDSDGQITLFDSVGIGLEDYSALRLAYELSNKYNLGQDLQLTPPIQDPKNLYSALQ